MKPVDRLAKTVSRIRAFRETNRRRLDDHEAAQQGIAELDGWLNRLDGIKDCFDDPMLVETASADLAAAEEYIDTLTFFEAPPKAKDVEVPDPEEDDSWREERISWRFSDLDLDHPEEEEHADAVGRTEIVNIIAALRAYEDETWRTINNKSPHNHAWEDYGEWEKASRDRVEHLKLDDQSSWYQLYLDNLGRLYGFRIGSVFNILWWDRFHKVYIPKKYKKKSQK